MQNYHLVPTEKNRWRLIGEGSDRTLCDFDTKEQALSRCAVLLQPQSGSLKIHKVDGTFEEERTYPRSSDPVASKG